MSPGEVPDSAVDGAAVAPLAGVDVGSEVYRLARAGYIAFSEQSGSRYLPAWEDLTYATVLAWVAAAVAISAHRREGDA